MQGEDQGNDKKGYHRAVCKPQQGYSGDMRALHLSAKGQGDLRRHHAGDTRKISRICEVNSLL